MFFDFFEKKSNPPTGNPLTYAFEDHLVRGVLGRRNALDRRGAGRKAPAIPLADRPVAFSNGSGVKLRKMAKPADAGLSLPLPPFVGS
jgi:hypothetical protein